MAYTLVLTKCDYFPNHNSKGPSAKNTISIVKDPFIPFLLNVTKTRKSDFSTKHKTEPKLRL